MSMISGENESQVLTISPFTEADHANIFIYSFSHLVIQASNTYWAFAKCPVLQRWVLSSGNSQSLLHKFCDWIQVPRSKQSEPGFRDQGTGETMKHLRCFKRLNKVFLFCFVCVARICMFVYVFQKWVCVGGDGWDRGREWGWGMVAHGWGKMLPWWSKPKCKGS